MKLSIQDGEKLEAVSRHFRVEMKDNRIQVFERDTFGEKSLLNNKWERKG